MMGALRIPGAFAMVAGFALWGAGFAIVYGVLSYGCAAGWHELSLGPASLQRIVVVALSLLTLIATAVLVRAVASRRAGGAEPDQTRAFMKDVAVWSGLAATASVVFTFSGVAVLSTCT